MQSYHHFTLLERENLYLGLQRGKSLRKIAKELNKNVSSVSREIKRNQNKNKSYHPWRATTLYIVRRKKCVKNYVVESNIELKEWIEYGFSQYWSPEIIASTWKQKGNHVSHSTIYSALKKGLIENFTPKNILRRHGKRKQTHKCYTIHPDHHINERPLIVERRGRLGDWEGDTIYGSIGKGYLVTCVDRKSRYLAASIAKDKYNETINEAFKEAFQRATHQIPIKTITLDNGSEFGGFRELEKELDTEIYFADPHSPWQRGSNENLNDLLRFFFPRGTDFRTVSQDYLDFVISLINNRPRKCLGWLSPNDFILSKCCT